MSPDRPHPAFLADSAVSHDVLSEFRYETKIPMEKGQYIELQAWLLGALYKPRETFPRRTIHSIYCDDVNLTNYFENVSGISDREKVRLRWYNDYLEAIALERKLKTNKLNRKDVVHLKNPDKRPPETFPAILKLFEQNDIEHEFDMDRLKPIVETCYDRDYFELAPGVRLTLDTSITTRRLNPAPSEHKRRSPVFAVMEIKYPPALAPMAKESIKGIPFRIFRHSKYVVGVDSVYR